MRQCWMGGGGCHTSEAVLDGGVGGVTPVRQCWMGLPHKPTG